MKIPVSRREWQAAADAALALLLLDAARGYGLATGGPLVDVARAEALLGEAYRRHGVSPAADCVERFVEDSLARNDRALAGLEVSVSGPVGRLLDRPRRQRTAARRLKSRVEE